MRRSQYPAPTGASFGYRLTTRGIDPTVTEAQIALETVSRMRKHPDPMGPVLHGCRKGANTVWLSDKRLACKLPVYIQLPLAAALP